MTYIRTRVSVVGSPGYQYVTVKVWDTCPPDVVEREVLGSLTFQVVNSDMAYLETFGLTPPQLPRVVRVVTPDGLIIGEIATADLYYTSMLSPSGALRDPVDVRWLRRFIRVADLEVVGRGPEAFHRSYDPFWIVRTEGVFPGKPLSVGSDMSPTDGTCEVGASPVDEGQDVTLLGKVIVP